VPGYSNAIGVIFGRLGNNFNSSKEQVDNKLDSYDDLIEIWQPDDYFNQVNLADLFVSYLRDRDNYLINNEGPRAQMKIDFEKSRPSPWSRINDTFAKLGFEYKFNDEYELTKGIEIKDGLKLLDKQNNPLPYDINSLSDGEKTIFSIAVAALRAEILGEKPQLLLLDEYDAPLNPSLTEALFQILDTYFIQKGTVVIMTTHSTDTIMLAPTSAVLYEVCKRHELVRFKILNKTKYSEYKKIHDKHINDEVNFRIQLEELSGVLIRKNQPLIITEGKTDWKYFIKALRYFQSKDPVEFSSVKEEYFLKFGNQADVDGNICGTEFIREMGGSELEATLEGLSGLRSKDHRIEKHSTIGIYDSDDSKIKIINDSVNKVFSLKITPDGISSEFLFDLSEIKSEVNGTRLYRSDEFDLQTRQLISDRTIVFGGDTRLSKTPSRVFIIDSDVFDSSGRKLALSKNEFAKAVFDGTIQVSDTTWENFRPIFAQLETFLTQTNPSV
jgi:ABC-type taurine transport system ATPase subunit